MLQKSALFHQFKEGGDDRYLRNSKIFDLSCPLYKGNYPIEYEYENK